jgi:hypothetical protein
MPVKNIISLGGNGTFNFGKPNLVSYDAVNRNKVSIRQLSLFIFSSYSLHVSAPTGHPQVRNTIDVYKDYSYYNGSVVRTQLDACLWYFDPWSPIHVIKCSIKIVKNINIHCDWSRI